MGEWKPTGYKGIRYKEHSTRKRKNGIGKDRYYAIRHAVDGKKLNESVGWETDGWTLERANHLLSEFREAKRTGMGPRSLREKRKIEEARKEAEREAEEERRRAAVTVSDFWREEYLPHAKTSGKTARTWKSEEGHFRNWIGPAIGGRTLGDVSFLDLERIKRDMLKAGKASQTVTSVLATIRQMFNRAIKTGAFLGPNPVSLHKVKAPKSDNRRTRFLSPAEAGRLLAALEHVEDVRDMALLSLHCGLRFSEIAALEWNRADLENGLVILSDTKGKRGRQIPMTDDVRVMLKRRRESVRVAWGLVFPTVADGVKSQVSGSFNRAVKALGLNDGVTDKRQKVVFHTLRHTFASWMVQRGVPLYTVGKLMGHTTASMTQRYAHLAPGNLRAAVDDGIPSLDEMTGGSTDEAKAAEAVTTATDPK